MEERALGIVVVGGAGRVGQGLVEAFRERGHAVRVVDPAADAVPGSAWDLPATRDLAQEVGTADLVVLSLPSAAGGPGRPSAVAAAALPGRFAALELALAVLGQGGRLVELAGGAAAAPGHDEAGWVARWQHAVHRGLWSVMAGRIHLCAIEVFVGSADQGPSLDPRDLAAALLELGRDGAAPAFVRIGAGGIAAVQPEHS